MHHKKYNVILEKKVNEYSSDPVDLGKLQCKYLELYTGDFKFDADWGSLDGRSIEALKISAEKTIAQAGTYNLVTKNYNGEGSKEIIMSNVSIPLNWGTVVPYTAAPIRFFVALDEATVLTTEFTFTATLDNSKVYSGKATPASDFTFDITLAKVN